MKAPVLIRRLVTLLIMYATLPGFARQPKPVIHLSVADGLSQSSVYSILQDSYGFIWLATGDGINRYDGKQFLPYKSYLGEPGLAGLKDRNVNSRLFEDKYHNLWFSADEGVYCLNRRRRKCDMIINKYQTHYAGRVIAVDSIYAWVAVPGQGIYRITTYDHQVECYWFSDSAHRAPRGTPVILGGLQLTNGLLLADTKGLIYFNEKKHKDERVLVINDINSVFRTKKGIILLFGNDCYWQLDSNLTSAHRVPLINSADPGTAWRSVVEDTATGTLFIGSFNNGTICRLAPGNSLPEFLDLQKNPINYLMLDGSRNLWIGTEGDGIFRYDLKPPKFHSCVPARQGSTGYMVKSIYQDSNEDIWLGTFGKGLFKFRPAIDSQPQRIHSGIPDNANVTAILNDSTGRLIIGANNKVWIANKTNSKEITELRIPYYSPSREEILIINSLLEWRKGHYLAGTSMGLFSLWQESPGGKWTIHMIADSVIGGWVYDLYKTDNSRDIYVGRRNGFARCYMLTNTTYYISDSGLKGLPVRHFCKLPNSPTLWIATEQGLIARNETTRDQLVFDERQGLANSYTYAIVPENDSTLWVSTNGGISRASIYGQAGKGPRVRFSNYTTADGLQSNEFNTGAYYKGPGGTIIFGGIAGFNWFKPVEVWKNPYQPRPAITNIYINDSLLASDTAMFIKQLELPYNRSTLGLTIRALEYTNPSRNRLAYKMEGLDKDWVYTTSDYVRYAHIPHGKYRFLLKASNNDGVWNNAPVSISITITPPFWQTWWFRLNAIMLAVIAIAAIVRYYTHLRMRQRMRVLEKQHALNMERLRISKDVHDDIGSGLSRISLLSELTIRKLESDNTSARDVRQISAISKELVDNMRDLIWVLNPENTTLDSLLSRIREYCSDYIEGTDIKLMFFFPDVIPDLPIARNVQRNLFLTIKEAVNNVVKYAQADKLKLEISITQQALSVTITDNGKGFDLEAVHGGNGLRNMRHRISAVGGSWEISSSASTGTTIYFSVPLNRLNVEAEG